MGRASTITNLYEKKFKTLPLDNGIWKEVLGDIEGNGIILIWGPEKNGKTWLSLMLADMLSKYQRVLYVSAEEGLDKSFIDACKRAQISAKNKSLHFDEYIPINELSEKLKKRKSARIVFLDNLTIYNDELRKGGLQKLKEDHPEKIFALVAHEERGEPYTASAKLAKKLAKVIIYVKGLSCFVSGRVPGGTITIDENRALLYHGEEIKN